MGVGSISKYCSDPLAIHIINAFPRVSYSLIGVDWVFGTSRIGGVGSNSRCSGTGMSTSMIRDEEGAAKEVSFMGDYTSQSNYQIGGSDVE